MVENGLERIASGKKLSSIHTLLLCPPELSFPQIKGVFIRCILGVTFWVFPRSWSAKDSSFLVVLGDSGDIWNLLTLSGP